MAHWVTVKEASELLNRTDRSIRRWIAKGGPQGKLPVDRTQKPLLVDISAYYEEPREPIDSTPGTVEGLRIAYQAAINERDYLRQRLEEADERIRHEQDSVRMLTGIIDRRDQLLLDAPRPRRRIRWPWQRNS